MGARLSSLPPPAALAASLTETAGLAAAALVLVLYARHTATNLRAHHAMLSRQEDRLPRGQHVRAVLRYTLWGQFFATTQYMLCLVKPSMGRRILRSFVWKPRGALRDVVYGPQARHTLDLYGVGGQKKPVVVFVHGGTWTRGSKWVYALVGECLAMQGALVAVINYRTFPTGSAIDMVDDVNQAVLWVIDYCHEFGGDERRVFLVGHSAGAHLGALALTRSALRVADGGAADSKQREIVRNVVGFIGLAGPYHLADHYRFEHSRVFGPIKGIHEISATKPSMLGERNFDRLSPTVLIEDAASHELALNLPPFYLLHGLNEAVVPTSSSKRLAAALRQAGQRVEYAELADCTHFDIIFAAMGEPVKCRDAVIKHIHRIVFAYPLLLRDTRV